jgi:hypothetical protein
MDKASRGSRGGGGSGGRYLRKPIPQFKLGRVLQIILIQKVFATLIVGTFHGKSLQTISRALQTIL